MHRLLEGSNIKPIEAETLVASSLVGYFFFEPSRRTHKRRKYRYQGAKGDFFLLNWRQAALSTDSLASQFHLQGFHKLSLASRCLIRKRRPRRALTALLFIYLLTARLAEEKWRKKYFLNSKNENLHNENIFLFSGDSSSRKRFGSRLPPNFFYAQKYYFLLCFNRNEFFSVWSSFFSTLWTEKLCNF